MPSKAFGRWWSGLARLIRALIVAGGLVVIALLSAWLTVILVIRGREVLTPDLAGLETGEALQLLQHEGLVLHIMEGKSQFSEEIAADRVLRQIPEAGSWLKKTRKVKVILSLGPQRLNMPDLMESTVQHTRIQINQSGFNMGGVAYAFWNGVPENRIVAQDPGPGDEEYRGRRVNLLVSRGAREVAWVMPDLIGLRDEPVRRRLEAAGFRLGRFQYVRYEGLGPGLIVDQSPPVGHPVTRRRIIELTVNR